ncbi:hypothetical protein BGZ76_011763 [Entomortierella beljakovae]|nr:hypothetical protein BGZ76_011763 [Entomortierella beljakovae]
MSTNEIESDLPVVRGEAASIIKYYEELEQVKEARYNFYDGDKNIVKRHHWDARKARDNEYLNIANCLLKLAWSLGYIVVGVNEYYTLKNCPTCKNFVGQVEVRRLYCKTCQAYMHRDAMAGYNICNVVRSHLLEQPRPEYLQPVDEKGNYPWRYKLCSLSGIVGSSGLIEVVGVVESSGQIGSRKIIEETSSKFCPP